MNLIGEFINYNKSINNGKPMTIADSGFDLKALLFKDIVIFSATAFFFIILSLDPFVTRSNVSGSLFDCVLFEEDEKDDEEPTLDSDDEDLLSPLEELRSDFEDDESDDELENDDSDCSLAFGESASVNPSSEELELDEDDLKLLLLCDDSLLLLEPLSDESESKDVFKASWMKLS